jgi:hypothetical protein
VYVFPLTWIEGPLRFISSLLAPETPKA